MDANSSCIEQIGINMYTSGHMKQVSCYFLGVVRRLSGGVYPRVASSLVSKALVTDMRETDSVGEWM